MNETCNLITTVVKGDLKVNINNLGELNVV